MSHYFFHLHEAGHVTRDEEGLEMPDLAVARRHAETAAREIMCADMADGDLCLACQIEIEDRDSGARTILAFRDAVTITGQ
jgi:antirestriction protein ArdC